MNKNNKIDIMRVITTLQLIFAVFTFLILILNIIFFQSKNLFYIIDGINIYLIVQGIIIIIINNHNNKVILNLLKRRINMKKEIKINLDKIKEPFIIVTADTIQYSGNFIELQTLVMSFLVNFYTKLDKVQKEMFKKNFPEIINRFIINDFDTDKIN